MRFRQAGLGVNFMTMDFRQPREPVVVSPASAGVSASVSQAAAPIEDASIVKTDNSFPLGGIIGIAVGGGLLLLLAGEGLQVSFICQPLCAVPSMPTLWQAVARTVSWLLPARRKVAQFWARGHSESSLVCVLQPAVILIVCCARRQRRASTARKLNAACEVRQACWMYTPALK